MPEPSEVDDVPPVRSNKISLEIVFCQLGAQFSARCLLPFERQAVECCRLQVIFGQKQLGDFSALAAAGAGAAIVDAATAAPVVARNSRLLIIVFSSGSHAWSSPESLTARLITHFAEFESGPY